MDFVEPKFLASWPSWGIGRNENGPEHMKSTPHYNFVIHLDAQPPTNRELSTFLGADSSNKAMMAFESSVTVRFDG